LVRASTRNGADALEITPLPSHRLAEDFEALRDASDEALEGTGARPLIFLANLGPIAHHTARATFARNFFEAGGVEALTNTGFSDAEDCAAAFTDSGARVAVICSSDKIYADQAEPAARALKAAGCEKLYLAGRPGDKQADFEAAGIDAFIFVGCDVLGTLQGLHAALGVTSR
jgi:methylmalonyl-CoA mutase